MAMASVINISKYTKKEDNYITFLKGIREIPDYFIKFIGADKDIKRDLREQTRKWIEAINTYLKDENGNEIKDIQLIMQDLIQKVKVLKKEQKEKNKCKTSTTTKVAVGVSVAVGAIALYGLYKMFTSNFTDEDVGYLVSGDDIR